MGSVTSDQSHDTGLQSEIARWFSALGAKHVEPDFASFRNCEGRLRYAADLTDFEETQPVALIIMSYNDDSHESSSNPATFSSASTGAMRIFSDEVVQYAEQVDNSRLPTDVVLSSPLGAYEYKGDEDDSPEEEAYEEDISGPRRTAIAVPVSGFSEFKALQAGLTAAFNTEMENMSLNGLTIFGMYIAPDKGLPAREPDAYTASAFFLCGSSCSAMLFEPEIQRAKIRNSTSAEPSVAQVAKPPSSGFKWRAADSSTRFANYTQS